MRSITLHLVNDLGSDSIGGSIADVPHQWPGTEIDYDVTLPPEPVPVWIALNPDGSDNQVYPINTPIATMLSAGWTRIYQGTELFGQDGSVQVVSENLKTVQTLIAACCQSSWVTIALALKTSPAALEVGQEYPCGTEALFHVIAIKGKNETRTMVALMRFVIKNADDSFSMAFWVLPGATDADPLMPFTETVQFQKNWPEDFIGLTAGDGISEMIPNDQVPGPNQYRPIDFEGGTIEIESTIWEDLGAGSYGGISTQSGTFALPSTDCDDESASASPEGPELRIANGTVDTNGADMALEVTDVIFQGESALNQGGFDFPVPEDSQGYFKLPEGTGIFEVHMTGGYTGTIRVLWPAAAISGLSETAPNSGIYRTPATITISNADNALGEKWTLQVF